MLDEITDDAVNCRMRTLDDAIGFQRNGQASLARIWMQNLIEEFPIWDEPVLRLGGVFGASNQRTAAIQAYRGLLALHPNRREALLALGLLLIASQSSGDAVIPLLRGCGLSPRNSETWTLLGRALMDIGEFALALAAFMRALRLAPRSIVIAHEFVAAAAVSNRAQSVVTLLESVCALNPLNPIPHVARGMLLDRLGLQDAAVDALEAAVALAPAEPGPIGILAGLLTHTARSREAEEALRAARELDPGNPGLMNDHAAMLMRLHRHPAACRMLYEVLWESGPHTSVVCNIANATVCLGLQDEAVELARAAIALAPKATLPRRALTNTLPYLEGVTGADLLQAARACGDELSRGLLPQLRKVGRRRRLLTIGLLSGSLRTHPVGWLTVAGFENLDPARFRVVCLGPAPELSDPIARRFKALAWHWENAGPLDDDSLARRARELDIDIVIDLGGHGEAGRIGACMRRLAPVQIKWVGMQNHSSGLPEIDWFLTDRWESPAAFETRYSERMLRMPDGYVCYSAPPHAPDDVSSPILRNGFVTFGCCNNIAKVTLGTIVVWCEILQAVPGSRLILKTHQLDDCETVKRVSKSLTSLGIDACRLDIRGSSPHRALLATYNEIDIVLDPFPYSGGLSTCEALWMGVPTVTFPGDTFASRHSSSHLNNAGFSDWIACNAGDYKWIALKWASDRTGLAELRQRTRTQVRVSPLCDAPRFGRALGSALHHAWSNRE